MEYTLTELLTRGDLLHILNERQLKVPDLESLPLEELKRIYKAFVTPLARREPINSKRSIHNNIIAQNRIEASIHSATNHEVCSQLHQIPIAVDMQEPTRSCTQDQQAHSIVAMELEISALKNIPPPAQLPLCQKRLPHPITEEYLSKATKRIKIAWT